MSTETLRRLAWLVPFVATACGDHYTTQEADAVCEELKERISTLDNEETFAECVACHEDCGDECETPDFTCPD